MALTASFFFYGSLLEFPGLAKREHPISYSFKGSPAIKDTIEAIGVPHPEIDVIFINGISVDLKYKLQHTDRVHVYPKHKAPLLPQTIHLIQEPILPFRFVLDVHLGKLSRLLRMLGFDTAFDPSHTDKRLLTIALEEPRLLLTRDVDLLKHKNLTQGYWLRSQLPKVQLKELIRYYDLQPHFKLFSRCMVCNGSIEEVNKADVEAVLPPKARLYFNEFYQCSQCRRVYWKGSHYERMQRFILDLESGL